MRPDPTRYFTLDGHTPVPCDRETWLATRAYAGYFEDCDSNPVPVGTFTVDMHAVEDSRWTLIDGMCPNR